MRSTPEAEGQNPYAAPVHRVENNRPGHGLIPKRLGTAWAVVFAANLVVPLGLGWSATVGPARPGMFTAIGVVLATGAAACYVWPKAGWTVVYGAVPVALTQSVPVLQMFAGYFGLAVGSGLTGEPWDGDENVNIERFLSGVFATGVTGGVLLAVSAGTGLFARVVLASRFWPDRGTPRPGT